MTEYNMIDAFDDIVFGGIISQREIIHNDLLSLWKIVMLSKGGLNYE